MNADLVWKVVSIVVSLVVLPLMGWIWTTSGNVHALNIEHDYTRERVVKIEKEATGINENSTDLKLLQKDVEFIKKEVQEISKHLKAGGK